jgi:predicted lactoylglutathione lyase
LFAARLATAEDKEMNNGISVVTLGVNDLAAAAHFYGEGLGFKTASVKGGVTYFDTGGTWLAIFPRAALARYAGVSAEGEGFSGVTLSINLETRDDVDKLLERARSVGAEIVKAAGEVGWGGYTGWIRDPCGHLWEMVWNPRPFVGKST